MSDLEESVPLRDKPSYDFDDIERQGRPTKWSTAAVNGILAPKGRTLQLWNNIFVISCVVAVSLDPLFLYIPIINEENKCLGMDKKLRNAALVLRSLTDIIFVVRIVHQIRTKLEDSEEPAEGRESLGWKWRPLLCVPLIIDLLAILPIPQLAIVVVFFRTRGSGYLQKINILNAFLLFQYVPNVYRLHISSEKLQKKERRIKGAFNFFLYILASHVLGAFWYFFSIQRETTCWHQACRNTEDCIASRYCNDSTSRNITFINEFCPINPSDPSLFDFGMFLDALQSGNTGPVNFPRKFFYSFWWGIRNLSNFGTSLETSSYVWENCFAILIAVIGLLLFLYLIGNLQTYMQWAAAKAEEQKEDDLRKRIKLKEDSIDDWMLKHGLPQDLKKEIMDIIKENNVVEKNIDAEVDVKYLFSIDLPRTTESSIKHHVGMNVLNKVPVLQNMRVEVLKTICDHLKPQILYPDNINVFRRGKAIDFMLFIIEGTISIQENASEPTESTPGEGDYFGKELLYWASPANSFDLKVPSSTQNVRCQTKVEAFALKAEALRSIVLKYRRTWNRILYNCDINYPQLEELELARSPHDKTEQTYMQLWEESLRLQKLKVLKDNDILEWVSRNGLPENIKKKIMENITEINAVKKNIDVDVDVDFVFSILPHDVKEAIKVYVGMGALKKVPMLKNMPESSLKVICKYLEPVIYSKNDYLIRARKPLNSMLFIIEGVIIWPNTANEAVTAGSYMINQLCLVKGDLYGEELLSWASPGSRLSDLPISTQDVCCQTKVEALALKAEKMQSMVSELRERWTNYYIAPPQEKTYLQILNETYRQLKPTKLDKVEDEDLRQKMKIMTKERDILEWLSRNDLDDDLKTKIIMHMKLNKIVDENINADVNVEYLSNNIPFGIAISIKRQLCISTLKKVPMLEKMPENVFANICYELKPVTYTEDSYIVRAGEQLDLMLIIVEGKILQTDMTLDTGTTGSSMITNYLEKGDFCGEDLLSWASPNILFSGDAPVSTHDVRCETKVEGFALTADKLRSFISQYPSEWISNFNNCNNLQQLGELAFRPDNIDKILNELGATKVDDIEDEELKKKMKTVIKEKHVQEWLSRNCPLDEDLKTKVMMHLKLNKILDQNNDAAVDVEYISNNLPFGTAISIKRHLCISTLKKVPMLEKMPEDVFSNICYDLKPVTYTEDSYIVRAGEKLDLMLIIVEGKILPPDMNSDNGTTGSPMITKYLEKGDFCGEELLNWASPNTLFSGHAPISTHDVKCETKVEGFALTVDKLRSFVSQYTSDWISHFNNSKS
ncbi:PREDICTED: uncharacterized protein LOC103325420 isoform X2 [Prunus mume]|uniref:Uncharacterized protein LOC103325420 isoform X2 n=1 Tax=Prunus mume TaxID=102107 RepID=A0ABM0NJP7_PRUMU|nr:PREDICTED: uncharacterized protein LOC103325420 isoform X2 [Prunus mume]